MEEKIVIKSFKDVPILSLTLQSTLWNRTGMWRYLRPSYVSLQAPCAEACPLKQDISFYLTALADGKPEEAWEKVLLSNPFPSVCGRVCHHPCEGDCNRKEYDEALAIHSLERFLGDWGLRHGKDGRRKRARKEQTVAVIGSGPAGLSCAYFLAREGYPVTVYEAMKEPGGMLRYGIPAYRLPRGILKREIERIRSRGVRIETQKKLGDNLSWDDCRSSQAIFLATGAHAEQKPDVPGHDLQGSRTGLDFLQEVNSGQKVSLGPKVIVVGGGNTAIDSARVAWRQGSQVTVLYRRTEEEMPAIAEEVEEAQKEGIRFIFQALPVEVLGKKGSVHSIQGLKTKPGKPDGSGRKSPLPVPGSDFSLKADSIIWAIGERADLSFMPEGLEQRNGTIAIDGWGRTCLPGVFAGGDAATGAGYVSQAIASGKRSAEAMIRFLGGAAEDPIEEKRGIPSFTNINLDYFSKQPRIKVPSLAVSQRRKRFTEVHGGFSPAKAREEAGRCFSCGRCIRCHVCVMVCPDVAISFQKGENQYLIDYDHCKGCGICVVECPRSAMALEEEKWNE